MAVSTAAGAPAQRSQAEPVTDAARIPELDGVRGFAALLVVYVHLFLMWVPAPNPVVFWLRTFSGMAWTGVILFFVLSGFLIGGNLLKHRGAENFFQVFYFRRAFRIFPLYFALLATYLILRAATPFGQHAAFNSQAIPFWCYALLVQNFPMAVLGDWGIGVLGVTWSVALEEQFYLFLPPLIRFLPPRWCLPVICLTAATGPLFRQFVPVAHAPFLMPGAIESLFGGVLLAWLYQNRAEVFRQRRWIIAAGALFVLAGLGMALKATRREFGALGDTIIAAFWFSFLWLVLIARGTVWSAFFRMSWLRGVGRISYGVYLFHGLIYHLVFHTATGEDPTQSYGAYGALLAAISFVLVLIFATISFQVFERRLIGIGQARAYRE